MRKVKYLGSDPGGVADPVTGTHFPHGEPVEVDDDLAARLLDRPDFVDVGAGKAGKRGSAAAAGRDVETR